MNIESEEKVWGRVSHIFDGEVSVSLLQVARGYRCSIHHHVRRFNAFHVVSGLLRVVIYEENLSEGLKRGYYTILEPGDKYEVPPGVWHRFEVLQSGRVVEIYRTEDGSPSNKDDIIRRDEGGILEERYLTSGW